MFDTEVDNKFRVFWFVDEEDSNSVRNYFVYILLWFFRVSSSSIFFNEYYYLENYMVNGI